MDDYIKAYELLEIRMKEGEHTEVLYARPIKWNKDDFTGEGIDDEGHEIEAVEWEFSCPDCGQLSTIDKDNVVTIDGYDYTFCKQTNYGFETVKEVLDEIEAIESGAYNKQFRLENPIETGKMVLEEEWLITS